MSKADARILLRSAAILFLAMWAVTADSWGRALITFMMPIQSELGLKIAEIGNVFLAQILAFAVGSLVMATLIALAGLRWVYGAAILGDALVIVLLGRAHSLGWLVVASASRGFFGGAILAGGLQVIGEWFPQRLRGVATGLFLGAMQLATWTGPLVAVSLYDRPGRNSLFLLAGLGFLAFPLWVWLCKPGRSEYLSSLSISRALSVVFQAPQTLALMLGVLLTSPAGHFDFVGFMRGWYHRDVASLRQFLIILIALSVIGAPLGGLSSDLLIRRGWPSWKSRRLVAQTSTLCLLLLPMVFVPYSPLTLIFAGATQLGYQSLIAVLYAAAADSVPTRGLPFAVVLASSLSTTPSNWANLLSQNIVRQSKLWPILIGLTVMGASVAAVVVGHLLQRAGEPAGEYVLPPLANQPGGFWRRLTALILDFAVCGIAVYLVVNILKHLAATAESIVFVVSLAVISLWLYFAGLECSAIQATLGKRVLGIFVTDERGQRVSFARASGRHFGKILSSPLALGFLTAGFTERRQAVHDLISRCVVVRRSPPGEALLPLGQGPTT